MFGEPDEPPDEPIAAMREAYLSLTRHALPEAARRANASGDAWPITLDHCFMRVVLDHLFGQRWDAAIDRRDGPAYRQLNATQLHNAISIAESMLDGGGERVRTLDDASRRMRRYAS